MSMYRKKPVTIEARRLYGTNAETHAVYKWIEENTLGSFEPLGVLEGRANPPASGVSIDPSDGAFLIATLEGVMKARPGDWIIRGVQGEFYPVKDSIFRATYEPVEEVQPAPEWVSMCARCLTEHGPFVYDHGTTVCEVCIGKIILVEEAVASPVDGCTSDGVRFRDRP